MAVYNTFNYSKIVLRTFHATPQTIVLRELPASHHSHQRFPNAADVRSGTVYGPGLFEQQGYLAGTLVAGGGSAVYHPLRSHVLHGIGGDMSPVSLGDSVTRYFSTSSVSTGASANADSTPVVTVAEDGTDMAYTPTVTNVATGLYKVQLDCTTGNGFQAGRRYNVYGAATVGGVTGRAGLGEYEVMALDINAALDVAVGSRLSLNQFVGLS